MERPSDSYATQGGGAGSEGSSGMGQGGSGSSGSGGSGGSGGSPVDDATYNLISVLHAKLEGLEVLAKYQEDDDSGIFGEIAQQDRQQAERLLQALRQRLGGG